MRKEKGVGELKPFNSQSCWWWVVLIFSNLQEQKIMCKFFGENLFKTSTELLPNLFSQMILKPFARRCNWSCKKTFTSTPKAPQSPRFYSPPPILIVLKINNNNNWNLYRNFRRLWSVDAPLSDRWRNKWIHLMQRKATRKHHNLH